MGRIQFAVILAGAIGVLAPTARADDALRQKALRLNDVTGKDAIRGSIRDLVRDRPASKALIAEAAEMAKDKDQPFNYNAAYILARVSQVNKDFDRSLLFYKVCVEHAVKLRSGQKLVEVYDALIALFLDHKKYDDAVRACREFLDIRGGRELEQIKPFVLEQMILALSKGGKTDDALKMVEKIVEDNRDNWYFLRLKAEVLAEANRPADAAAAYEDAVERLQDAKGDGEKPDAARVEELLNRCRLSMERVIVDLIRRSRHDDALGLISELVKSDLYFARLKGEVLRDAGKLDDSAAALEAAIEQVGGSNKLNDKMKKAIVERCRYVLSGVYTDLNQIDKATAQLKTLLEEHPDNSTYNNDLGYIWADHDMNLEESEKLIRKALELDKKDRDKAKEEGLLDAEDARQNPAYLDSMGWVLFKKKRFAEARKYLEDAVAQEENPNVEILDHLADVLLILGEKDKAISTWKRALESETQSKRDAARKEIVRKKLEKELGGAP